MRTGSTKCLTRKLLLGIGAALGNGGLRKKRTGARPPDHCPGIRGFLVERNSGKGNSEYFSSLYPLPEKGEAKGRGGC